MSSLQMKNEYKTRGKTNSHGVSAPVLPRSAAGTSKAEGKSREVQIKRLAAKHKTAFSLLAKR